MSYYQDMGATREAKPELPERAAAAFSAAKAAAAEELSPASSGSGVNWLLWGSLIAAAGVGLYFLKRKPKSK